MGRNVSEAPPTHGTACQAAGTPRKGIVDTGHSTGVHHDVAVSLPVHVVHGEIIQRGTDGNEFLGRERNEATHVVVIHVDAVEVRGVRIPVQIPVP